MKVFFDASVLFAAAYSKTGAARDLLLLAVADRLEVVVSPDVLTETERNLTRKAREKLAAYRQLLEAIGPTVVPDPAKDAVWAAEAYVAQKDAPIIAAARSSAVDYLVTYDRKHLIEPREVAEKPGLRIVTPDVVVVAVLAEENEENDDN